MFNARLGTVAKIAYRPPRALKPFIGHPSGLAVLFTTEMWERFSYYGMRALLMLYLTKYLIPSAHSGTLHVYGLDRLQSLLEFVLGPLTNQALASQIYGIYTAFVYFTPLLGGLIADRFFGQRRMVVIGGVLMSTGHFLMTIESFLLPALFVLIIGNGCFKPNAANQVGRLYSKDDGRRDSAFALFYLGINFGALLAPLVSGTLGQWWGWSYGFGAAGFGMLLGLIIYVWGQKRIVYVADNSESPSLNNRQYNFKASQVFIAVTALCLLNVAFWGVVEQQGNSLQIFADSHVDWHIWNFQIPSTWLQVMNPLFMIVLTPLLALLWDHKFRSSWEFASVDKMIIGGALLSLSFVPLAFITKNLGSTQTISFLWLAGCTLGITAAELHLSPVGLSLVTKISPVRLQSTLVGLWFISAFLGNYLAGYLGSYYDKMAKFSFFLVLIALGLCVCFSNYALRRPIGNLLRDGANNSLTSPGRTVL